MPFKSQAQRRWMYTNYPKMAKKWSKHTKKNKKLPEHVNESMNLSVNKHESTGHEVVINITGGQKHMKLSMFYKNEHGAEEPVWDRGILQDSHGKTLAVFSEDHFEPDDIIEYGLTPDDVEDAYKLGVGYLTGRIEESLEFENLFNQIINS